MFWLKSNFTVLQERFLIHITIIKIFFIMQNQVIRMGTDVENKHRCYVEQEGDWMVFLCPACPDYERRIHSKTGEMQSKCSPYNEHRHFGIYVRPGFATGLYMPN